MSCDGVRVPTGSFLLKILELKFQLHGDQSAVPSHEGNGSDEGGNFAQDFMTEGLALCSQPASLVICQTEPSSPQLFPEDAVLFL